VVGERKQRGGEASDGELRRYSKSYIAAPPLHTVTEEAERGEASDSELFLPYTQRRGGREERVEG